MAHTQSGGVSFLGLLAILFIGLKLSHNITWSWWWVLAPIWIPAAIGLSLGAAILLTMVIVAATGRRSQPKRWAKRFSGC